MTNAHFLLSLIICATTFPIGFAVADEPTVPSADANVIDVRQWSMTEIRLIAGKLPQQPADAELSAKFTHSSGESFDVPGFWNGGNQYTIRFTPPRSGTWKYVTASSISELDGETGSVTAQAADESRSGGVIIDPDAPRRFRYQNGKSYFPIAFECDWLFALDAENPDDIPVTRKFVDRLATSGFNQIVMNVFAYDVNWKKDDRLVAKFDYGSPDVYPFGGSNQQPDHSQLNIQYFQRLDRVIDYLDQQGIAAHLMIYVWNKKVNWPAANSDADDRYFDYVVKRYQAYPNIIWDISKEALGYGHNDVNYISRRIDRLRKLDAHKRLVTVHDYSYCKRFPKKLDFISVQLWGSELYGIMRKVVDDIPGKPILNIEHGGYEEGPYEVFTGNYTSAEVCLERAYQCVFAGTFPTHYWQGAAWNVVIADIDAMSPEQRPHLGYYAHMQTLINRYDLDALQAGGKHSNSGFCLHDGKERYVYYVPKENISMNLRLPKTKRDKTMTLTWFDPFTGKFSDPTTQTIEQWPVVKKSDNNRFAILIVDTTE